MFQFKHILYKLKTTYLLLKKRQVIGFGNVIDIQNKLPISFSTAVTRYKMLKVVWVGKEIEFKHITH